MRPKARAMILERFSAPLREREVEIPALLPSQILVEIEAAGVCGSDVHMWQGRDPRTPLPIILGHEGIGRIVETRGQSRAVTGEILSPGDRVIWNRGVSCGHCYTCAVLRTPSLCASRWVYGIHRSVDESPYLNGCYSSHIILEPGTDLFVVDGSFDPALLVGVSCSGATAAHVFELTPVTAGDSVVIYGPGPLGAFCVALACASGAQQVIVVGGTKERLEICRKLGATHLLNRKETDFQGRQEAIKALTSGRGVDLAIEAVGSLEATREALASVRVGGKAALVGYGEPAGTMEIAPFEEITRKNVHLQGVWVSDSSHVWRALRVVYQHLDPFASLVTHRLALEQVTWALELVEQRRAMKAVIIPTLGEGEKGNGAD